MKIAQLRNNQLIRIIIILVLLMIVSLIPYETLFDETHSTCIHYYFLGFQCPLCGMTRAVYEFTHFRVVSALRYNIVVALLPLYLVMDITTIFFRQNWLANAKKIVIALIIAGFLLLYAFRIADHFRLI